MVDINEEDYIAHYGTPRKSGRYPWGSGEDPKNTDFLGQLAELRKKGLSDVEVARAMGISTTELRAKNTIARADRKQAQIAMAERLAEKGTSDAEAARRMGIPGTTYRALLEPGARVKSDILLSTSQVLKKRVDDVKYLDVGVGTEAFMGISQQKLGAAINILKEQGYQVHPVNVKQAATGLDTRFKVLVPPGVTQKDVFLNSGKIKLMQDFSEDGGINYGKIQPPLAINPKRVAVVYKKDGGADLDGVVQVRRGVEDVSLGKSRYAQVRIQVGPGHFIKGMAIYKDDMPDGIDLLFNTNKDDTGNKLDALKPLKDDPNMPFGSVIKKQIGKELGTPKAKVTSAMNIVYEEGDWVDWRKTLSSQVLSKQTPGLIKDQLNVTLETRKQEYEDIMRLTNPTVKKKLLEDFASTVDGASVELYASRLPRQNWHVILPLKSIKPDEVFAPKYNDGERVALIRYPHAGTFEIADLRVNNKNREAGKFIGKDSPDAIGIHPKVAERLSGADFDGDTVLVIPNNSKKIKITPALEGLKGFDPQRAYPAYEGMPKMSKTAKQQQMGDISNLITDMTIRGASHSDIARAVRHSMVVIDAEKHNLNYKLSHEVNGIRQLKQQYQGAGNAGAQTLISLAKSPKFINDRKPRPHADGGPVDRETGRNVYVDTGKMVTKRDGTKELKKIKVSKLSLVENAHDLSSGTPVEKLYGDHANKLKDLANQARLSAIKTPSIQRSPSAAKHYAKEVKALDAALELAVRNSPLERQAQIITTNAVRARRAANPNMDKEEIKKIKFQELEKARNRTGASKTRIDLTPEQWEAIQAGAISNDKLQRILRQANMKSVKELATPKTKRLMTSAKSRRAMSMLAMGYTRAEVANALGVSMSTLDLAIKGEG